MDATELIPAPRKFTPGSGPGFILDAATTLDAAAGTEDVAHWLRSTLGSATGCPLLPPHGGSRTPGSEGAPHGPGRTPGTVRLRVDSGLGGQQGPEAYRLTVEAGQIELVGGARAGVFWGAQTLRQLFGPGAYRSAPGTRSEHGWSVAAQYVEDAPRFAWRGFMLDVSRHFTPKEGVLRYIDLLAAHKLNVLHLHLTDDQGWRIEIERWPELTGTGAWRPRTKSGHRASYVWDDRPHGGYYTHDDVREIVAYAAARYITVVPEIELPGHSQAAIAAYPELGNTDAVDTSSTQVWGDWGVSPEILAPADATLRFYEDVLEEVLELFPSRFVHLGGDECPKDQWRSSPSAQARMREEGLEDEDALQLWFVRHFDRWLEARGRRLIGWDEILQGGAVEPGSAQSSRDDWRAASALSRGAAVSSWRGYTGGIAAARAGHDVVMCPEQQVYLDHRQDGGADEPVPIGYVRTLSDVYHFEPVPPELAGTPEERYVLGTQANMWTEVTETAQRIDYQVFPRLVALAEVAWSFLPAPEERDFADFERRMEAAHYARLDAMGVCYRAPSGPRPWQRRPGLLGRPIEGRPPIV